MVFADPERFVRRISLGQSVCCIVTDERSNLAVHSLDVVEAGLSSLARGNLAFGQLRRQFGNRQLVYHGTGLPAARQRSGLRSRYIKSALAPFVDEL